MQRSTSVYRGALLFGAGEAFGKAAWKTVLPGHEALFAALWEGADNDLADIIREADTLARGGPPAEMPSEALRSIFSAIKHPEPYTKTLYQPPSRLTPDGYLFPTETAPSAATQSVSDCVAEIEQVGAFDDETLLHLMRKHLWCVPAPGYAEGDVSCYEHARITAALAVCLYEIREESSEEAPFLLLGADLTGIQTYLYSVAHKGALKALKGRSFLLGQILHITGLSFLDQLGLPLANLLYSSGGNLYLLAPNTETVRTRWPEAEATLQRSLFDYFGIDIGIVLASVPLRRQDFAPGTETSLPIAQRWEALVQALDQAKKHKFSTLFNDEDFFEPLEPSGGVVACHATGRYLCRIGQEKIFEGRKLFKYEPERDEEGTAEGKYISHEQHTAIAIGRELQKLDTLLVRSKPPSGRFYGMPGIGSFSLSIEPNQQNQDRTLRAYRVNDDDFLGLPAAMSRGWTFYGGNWTLQEDFTTLCENAVGIKRLGVLRMDVDNLGLLFQKGLGTKATITRITQLSAQLDFFFCGYLNILGDYVWDQNQGLVFGAEGVPLKEQLQIVYAGGDDLFIVGAWHLLPDVALWIREAFRRYTGHNPNFTLSGGIALFPAKFPLYKAAFQAGEAEEAAKRFIPPGSETAKKDAISFLDVPMNWHDFKFVRQQTVLLCEWIEKGKDHQGGVVTLSRGFLQVLQYIYIAYYKEENNLWGRWRWHAAYLMARYSKRQQAFDEGLTQLSRHLFLSPDTQQPFIHLLGVTARWAEFLTRKEQNDAN